MRTSRNPHPSEGLVDSLSKAFEISSDGFALVNRDGTILRVNAAWLAMHGFERDEEPEVIGRSLTMFHDAGQVESELRPLLARVAKAGSAQGPLGHVRCDGGPFQTWTSLAQVDSDGDGGSCVIMSRDLSAEPTAANALRRTGGFLHSVVENIPDMVFVRDAKDLRYVLVNRAGEEWLGLPRAELVGKSDDDLFPPEDARALTERGRAVLCGGAMVDVPEELVHTRTKGARWLHTKRIPIRDANGTPRYLLEVAEDITDRKAYAEAQEELRAAQAALESRDEFLSIAAHELRNPIGAALMQAGLALRQARSEPTSVSERMLSRFKSIHRVMQRMSALVNGLLDVSKTEAGQLDVRRETVDLRAVVNDVVQLHEVELERTACDLVVRADAPVVGEWDGARIEEVVSNLVSNAIKYGQGKAIHITVTEEPDKVARLTVRDHGIGIPVDDQAHIFDRFQRAQAARSFAGFGLGLWIVKRNVEAHAGAIHVASAPGQGSTFTIDLPQRAPG